MNQKGGAYNNKIKDVISDYLETTGESLNLGLSIMKFWSNRNFNSIDSLLYPLQQIVDKNAKILDNADLKDELDAFYNNIDKLEEGLNKFRIRIFDAMLGINLDISELDNDIKKGNFLKKVPTKRREAPGEVSPSAKINTAKESNKTENEETKPNNAEEETKTNDAEEETKEESPNKLGKKSKKKSKKKLNEKSNKKGGRRRTLKKALKKRNGRKLSKIRFN